MIKLKLSKCFNRVIEDGYRLSAIDGTVLELPDTALLRKEFGCSGNQNRMVARAKASCLFDVLNKVIKEKSLFGLQIGWRYTEMNTILLIHFVSYANHFSQVEHIN